MEFILQESELFKEGAPTVGQMLVYTRQEVIFKQYNDLSEVIKIFTENEVLEMHLFDKEKEYRTVKTRSKRVSKGYIETLISATDNKEDSYEEVVNVDGSRKLKVINILSYSETGMISIDNYRLVMEV